MASPDSPLAPRQARSRATAEALVAATIKILESGGLDAALIPDIAEAARVAPASVYRRFADKDALLRAAFLQVLRRSHEANRERAWGQVLGASLREAAAGVVELCFQQYRTMPGTVAALERFLETDADPDFVREARALLRANIELIVDALLVYCRELAHVPSKKVVRFAAFHCGSSAQLYMRVKLRDPQALWHGEPRMSEAEFARFLAHSLVTFLEHPPKHPAKHPPYPRGRVLPTTGTRAVRKKARESP